MGKRSFMWNTTPKGKFADWQIPPPPISAGRFSDWQIWRVTKSAGRFTDWQM